MIATADAIPLAMAAGSAAAAAALVIAAATDLARRIVPDGCSLAVAGTGLLSLLALPAGAAAGHLLFALLLVAPGVLAFRHGLVGGGDVKLIAGAGLWAGPVGLPLLLLAQAGATLLLAAGQLAFAARAAGGARPTIPLGAAIATGGIAAILERLGLAAGGG